MIIYMSTRVNTKPSIQFRNRKFLKDRQIYRNFVKKTFVIHYKRLWISVFMVFWKRCARFSVNKPCLSSSSISMITCACSSYCLVVLGTLCAHIRSHTCRTFSVAWAVSCNQIFTWHFNRITLYFCSCYFKIRQRQKLCVLYEHMIHKYVIIGFN